MKKQLDRRDWLALLIEIKKVSVLQYYFSAFELPHEHLDLELYQLTYFWCYYH